jgi:hypothetical protein
MAELLAETRHPNKLFSDWFAVCMHALVDRTSPGQVTGQWNEGAIGQGNALSSASCRHDSTAIDSA